MTIIITTRIANCCNYNIYPSFSVLPGPTNLRSTSTTSTSVTLAWDAPDSSSFSTPLTGYTVMWNSVQRTLMSVQLQYTIRQLIPFQEYQFSVRANFVNGGRSESISINVSTLEDGKLYTHIITYSS